MAAMRLSDLRDLEEEARELLTLRAGRIQDGQIAGRHWFIALIEEAREIQRRRQMWDARTAS